jgi:hypothetical protein
MSSYPPSGGYGEAQAKVSTPGLLLAIVGGLGIAGSLLSLLLNILNVGMGSLANGDERIGALFSGGLGAVFAIFGVVLWAVVTFGAIKMRNLQSYGLAMTAAILAMLPCSCCCVIGLPIGIWCLVVLFDENVKASFR